MNLKPYPEYKDSGIQWIGEIPKGWEIGRLKNKTLIKYGSSLSELDRQEGDIDVFGSNGIVGKHNRSITKGKTIIIGRKGSHGKVNLSKDSCFPIDTTYFIDKTCTRLNIKYLFYLLNQLKLDETSRDSAVPGLSRDITYNKIVPYISIKDQAALANFLDKKTAKIDSLIEKDKKLIELLKEKRTALINHAVTKGLDPNVKLKDSGIEWIGEIPEGWEVKKLKLVSNRIGDGIHTTPNYVDISDSYFINGNNLVNGRITITQSTRCVDEIELKKHRQPLNERTLLLSINGTIGNLAFYKGEQIILGKSAAYINLKKKIKVKYVYYFFHCNNIKYYFMKEVTGSTIWNLSLDSVKKTPILYPSSSEQIKIVQYLDKSTSKIDKTIKFIEKKIKLLEEYKKSLIHHVVTGKVDVRKSEV